MLIKQYGKDDKDGGIRHQKVDQKVMEKWGKANFLELCKELNYNSVEHFLLHCGAPQA
jgi:hypothetical protein